MGFAKTVTEREFEIDLFELESDFELRQMGRRDAGAAAGGAQGCGWRPTWLQTTTPERGRTTTWPSSVASASCPTWSGCASGGRADDEQRYNDMAYRMAENDALKKYRQQFDLAQTYTFLTAAAYDYETNLRGDDPAAGGKFLRDIVAARSLGEIRWTIGVWDIEPIVGSGGLAEPLGKMRDNFRVLKGPDGLQQPVRPQTSRFSLRQELFRLLRFLRRKLAPDAAALLHA